MLFTAWSGKRGLDCLDFIPGCATNFNDLFKAIESFLLFYVIFCKWK